MSICLLCSRDGTERTIDSVPYPTIVVPCIDGRNYFERVFEWAEMRFGPNEVTVYVYDEREPRNAETHEAAHARIVAQTISDVFGDES